MFVMLPSGSLHTLSGAMSEMSEGRSIPCAIFVRQEPTRTSKTDP
jgi:hypothetical protein